MSRTKGSLAELERRRKQAVAAVKAGESTAVVARILGVHPKSVSRWSDWAATPVGWMLDLTRAPHPA